MFTSKVVCRPGAQDTGSTSVLIKDEFVLLAGSTSPTAADFSFTDHLETHLHKHTAERKVERSQSSNGTFLYLILHSDFSEGRVN